MKLETIVERLEKIERMLIAPYFSKDDAESVLQRVEELRMEIERDLISALK